MKGKAVTVAIVNTSRHGHQEGRDRPAGTRVQVHRAENGEPIDVTAATSPESVDYHPEEDGRAGADHRGDQHHRSKDIATRTLSNIELSAYVTSLHINGMNIRETADLTKAMVNTGETINFDKGPIFDFHSIGGCPGNKVTLLIVPDNGRRRAA